MARLLLPSLLLGALILGLLGLSGAEEAGADGGKEARPKRDIPNWALTSSDFFGWVEELRKHAGYEKMDDLARTFWAHFPSADRLGYGTRETEE